MGPTERTVKDRMRRKTQFVARAVGQTRPKNVWRFYEICRTTDE